MVRKALLGAIMLIALAASPAAAQYSPTVVSPGTVTPGGSVSVSGQACQPGQLVSIYLRPVDSDVRTTVATVTADASGNYTTTFVVPFDLPLGQYMVEGSCGSAVNGKILNVVAQGTTAPPVTNAPGAGNNGAGNNGAGNNATGSSGTRSSSGRALARTGANLDRMGLVGAGLLVTGGLLLVATKRRRHASGLAI